jgi:DNA polymerase IV (archaeal DinB-like DNA polymerase)
LEKFGKMGLWMKRVANGLDFGDVREREESLKSISRHETFEEDTNDPVKIEGALGMLAGVCTVLLRIIVSSLRQ